MQPVTIPKKLAQSGDLVVIPREEYEDLLRTKKHRIKETPAQKRSSKDDKLKDFPKVSQKEKDKHPAFYARLDKDLDKAMTDYKKSKVVGPFNSVEELQKSLLG